MARRIPIVDLAAEYAEAGAAMEEAVLRCLRSGAYVLGPETAAFERELADLVGAGFAVGVGSGTEALTLTLRALGVGRDDEVITPAFTYFATVEAILACGARPVFVDLEPGSFSIDPVGVAAALGPRTGAMIPVHLFGRCADMERLLAVAAEVPIVEDAAQAIGAGRAGRRAGSWGAAGCFSFYPSKNLSAAGDGGGITTGDPELAERLRMLRSHGLDADGRHVVVGTTSRLDALQAAVLRAKLPFLKSWSDARSRNARIYGEELAGVSGGAVRRGNRLESVHDPLSRPRDGAASARRRRRRVTLLLRAPRLRRGRPGRSASFGLAFSRGSARPRRGALDPHPAQL
jgi:dTDP-4-amino-4,6-dideoxygalactose transaminase